MLSADIGAHDAAALLDEAGDLPERIDLPTPGSGPACRPGISPVPLAAVVRRWRLSRAWVEHTAQRAGDRPAGDLRFGASKATVETVLVVVSVPFRTITSATRKRSAGNPAGEVHAWASPSQTAEWWPSCPESFARARDHDRAEPCLIDRVRLLGERAGR